MITTVAGSGTYGYGGDGGPATGASLSSPSGVAVDASGNLFIADTYNSRVRKVDVDSGVISTVAGTGTPGYGGDGGPAATAPVRYPNGVAVDAAGNLFIADADSQRVRRVDAASGVITTVAGTGVQAYSGDGGLAATTPLYAPAAVAVDAWGNVFVADTNSHRVRRVDAETGVITTLAGSGAEGFAGDGARPRAPHSATLAGWQ